MPPEAIDPVVTPPFTIFRADRIATAGSCFAQHIARELQARAFNLIVEEPDPEDADDIPAWRAFSAAFGNIYTARQLLQLFERAYGVFHPQDEAWRRGDGRYVDPFRPTISKAGFATPEAVKGARTGHFAAVRTVFETCDVLIFTLGLTESWVSRQDGAVFPVPPGVEAQPDGGDYDFRNARVDEVAADLRRFRQRLRLVNPGARIILTVSPVPLIATYVPRHVLVSTIASKSILRAAADEVCGDDPDIAYFPSYKIITGPQSRGAYFGEDLRTITAEGVAQVMSVFARAYLRDGTGDRRPKPARAPISAEMMAAATDRMSALSTILCDEDLLDRGLI